MRFPDRLHADFLISQKLNMRRADDSRDLQENCRRNTGTRVTSRTAFATDVRDSSASAAMRDYNPARV